MGAAVPPSAGVIDTTRRDTLAAAVRVGGVCTPFLVSRLYRPRGKLGQFHSPPLLKFEQSVPPSACVICTDPWDCHPAFAACSAVRVRGACNPLRVRRLYRLRGTFFQFQNLQFLMCEGPVPRPSSRPTQKTFRASTCALGRTQQWLSEPRRSRTRRQQAGKHTFVLSALAAS